MHAPADAVWRHVDGAGVLLLGGVRGAYAFRVPADGRLECVVEPHPAGHLVTAVHEAEVRPGEAIVLVDRTSPAATRRTYTVAPLTPQVTRVTYHGVMLTGPTCVASRSAWLEEEARRTLGALAVAAEGRPPGRSPGRAGRLRERRTERLVRRHAALPVVRVTARAHVVLPVPPAAVWSFLADATNERVGHVDPAAIAFDVPVRRGASGGLLRGVVSHDDGALVLHLAELVRSVPGRVLTWRGLMSNHHVEGTLEVVPSDTGTVLREALEVDVHPGHEEERHETSLRAVMDHLAAVAGHLCAPAAPPGPPDVPPMAPEVPPMAPDVPPMAPDVRPAAPGALPSAPAGGGPSTGPAPSGWHPPA